MYIPSPVSFAHSISSKNLTAQIVAPKFQGRLSDIKDEFSHHNFTRREKLNLFLMTAAGAFGLYAGTMGVLEGSKALENSFQDTLVYDTCIGSIEELEQIELSGGYKINKNELPPNLKCDDGETAVRMKSVTTNPEKAHFESLTRTGKMLYRGEHIAKSSWAWFLNGAVSLFTAFGLLHQEVSDNKTIADIEADRAKRAKNKKFKDMLEEDAEEDTVAPFPAKEHLQQIKAEEILEGSADVPADPDKH